jgi:hypothetical protein
MSRSSSSRLRKTRRDLSPSSSRGGRFIAPGGHLTVTFDTAEPQEIDLAMHKEGLVFWRPIRGDVQVTIGEAAKRRSGEAAMRLPTCGSGGAVKVCDQVMLPVVVAR